jgi:DNA-binding transcriptional MerR regulator
MPLVAAKDRPMLIAELSKRSGLSRDTIRYYEKLRLLMAPNRHADNQYRNYGPEALERLRQIGTLKDMGFTLREIHRLLAAAEGTHPCDGLPDQLARKLGRIDEQVATLLKFKASLLGMQAACDGGCGTSNGVPACVPPAGASRQPVKCC